MGGGWLDCAGNGTGANCVVQTGYSTGGVLTITGYDTGNCPYLRCGSHSHPGPHIHPVGRWWTGRQLSSQSPFLLDGDGWSWWLARDVGSSPSLFNPQLLISILRILALAGRPCAAGGRTRAVRTIFFAPLIIEQNVCIAFDFRGASASPRGGFHSVLPHRKFLLVTSSQAGVPLGFGYIQLLPPGLSHCSRLHKYGSADREAASKLRRKFSWKLEAEMVGGGHGIPIGCFHPKSANAFPTLWSRRRHS